MEELLNSIVIFCDGACSGNPGPGGWGVIVATPEGDVQELGGRDPNTTNNRMELMAAIQAVRFVRDLSADIYIHTDSSYVINGITKWIFGWKKRGWVSSEGKPVANQELWEELLRVTSGRGKPGKIFWRYVRGHAEIPGNDRADEIAVAYSKDLKPALYRGSLLKYGIAIHDIPEDGGKVPEKKKSGLKKVAAYSYLSLVGGVPYRHSSWPECERRVKGQPGAKFKKAISAEDEKSIWKSWGVDPSKVSG